MNSVQKIAYHVTQKYKACKTRDLAKIILQKPTDIEETVGKAMVFNSYRIEKNNSNGEYK